MVKKKINKVLVANQGELANRIFRACTELNIRTVTIYSEKETGAFHRYKADEAYLVSEDKNPMEAILEIAKINEVDAIHPGFGFLSKNVQFAKRCEEEGIIFIGPKSEHLEVFEDKVRARTRARAANIPVIPGSDGSVSSLQDIEDFCDKYGYPIIIKASIGSRSRMKIVLDGSELSEVNNWVKMEFGNDEVYIEKLIENPKHIVVQIIGDEDGNIVHLYERDCSVQRSHQKIVEVAPSVSLSEKLRGKICNAAVQLMKNVNYLNAGTVEFLVTGEEFYFNGVNPGIQLEHTITEMITGIDIVQTQILIAAGFSLHSKELGIPAQDEIQTKGFAIQSRVIKEDFKKSSTPDIDRMVAYRDDGDIVGHLGFLGSVVTPYDSLLVKVSTWALSFDKAAMKMVRNLRELRIRSLKTNVPLLENVMTHEKFLSGEYDTSFIDSTPELFEFPLSQDPTGFDID